MVQNSTDDKVQKHEKFKEKKIRRDKSDLGDNFVAPDGGWGWLVCLAAGFSNLFAFPVLQQFGFLYRDHLIFLGFSNSQITSLINIHAAISAGSGLLNGPMFRRFTYRQVAFVGGFLIVIGLFFTSIANSFYTYVMTFSVFYGFGLGISLSASGLALNTYFKKKRRIATGFSWTITSIGPIVMPYIATGLLPIYGVQGTVMLFSGLALHIVVASLVYQPVKWHTKNVISSSANGLCKNENVETEKSNLCHNENNENNKLPISLSQYLCNENDIEENFHEIIDPGIPMLQTNGGLLFDTSRKFTSRLSLYTTIDDKFRNNDSNPNKNNLENVQKNKCEKGRLLKSESDLSKTDYFFETKNTSKLNKDDLLNEKVLISTNFNDLNEKITYNCKQNDDINLNDEKIIDKKEKLSLWKKIVIFFDLDLFKDFTYVNLMVGLTLANFAELNFSILTPFVLSDFGYEKDQAALAMSLLACLDTVMRFFIPFISEKVGWSNQSFYLFGVMGMAIGRIVIAHSHTYTTIIIAFIWIGLNKGLRTIFMSLVIPSHVTLKRLPAACGLQLLFGGIFCLVVGPLIGLIRDKTDYTVTLHCLNIATYLTAISWGLERLYRSHQNSKKSDIVLVP